MRFALFSFVIAALSGIQQAVSSPVQKLDSSLDPNTQNTLILIAEFENLEVQFYSQALQQFNATQFNASISALALRRYQEILEHEQTYVQLLQNVLGSSWPQPCQYNFSFQSVPDFLNLSLVIESIGTSAYTGAISNLTATATTPNLLTDISAILATKARHASWIGTAVLSVTPWGVEFETPLNAQEIFTLANQFTTSCPSSNATLSLQPSLPLNITGNPIPGQNVTVQPFSAQAQPSDFVIAFLSGLSTQYVPVGANWDVAIPANVSGTVYAVASSPSSWNTTGLSILAGPAPLLVEKSANGSLIN